MNLPRILWGLAALGLLASLLGDRNRTLVALRTWWAPSSPCPDPWPFRSREPCCGMAPNSASWRRPPVIVLLGLFDAWVPRKLVEDNIAIFLGSWGSIKVPKILLEASYLGLRFPLLRTGLTILGILATSWILERLVPESSLPG